MFLNEDCLTPGTVQVYCSDHHIWHTKGIDCAFCVSGDDPVPVKEFKSVFDKTRLIPKRFTPERKIRSMTFENEQDKFYDFEDYC